jgi:Domain of unknown function (DUF4281)
LERVFQLVNTSVLPFWVLMLVAPRWKFTRKLMENNTIFVVLGGAYTAMLATGVATNPAGMKDVMNPNLDGLSKLLSQRQGTLTGWTHFLVFDLFVGRWIYLDSLERDKPARLAILGSFLAGPLGLLFYLTIGRRKERGTRSKSNMGEGKRNAE